MGKIKYLKKIMQILKKSSVISTRDIRLIVKNRSYAYLLASYLVRKGKIKRVVKGFYSLHKDPIVAVFCFRPSYIGLQDALSLHNLWEQETATIIVTTKKIRPGIRKVFETNLILRRINPKYFFGFDFIKYGKFYIPVSDIEKTLIDFVYFKETIDKSVLKRIKRKMDMEKLKRYLKFYPTKIRKRVRNLLG